jgi:hypothetical protein
MDKVQVAMLRRAHCFRDGWGDLSQANRIAAELHDLQPPPKIQPTLGEPTQVLGAELRVGHFLSPAAADLAPEAQNVRFWWLHPADQEVRGAVVVPASWGDEGPSLRGRLVGPLVREGVSILIFENPYYGFRRRTGQKAGGLRTVSDFIHMQGAAFHEAKGLIGWLRHRVDGPVASVGFSMGGHLAAAVATHFHGVPHVSMAPPLSPSEPYTNGPLGRCVDWEKLGPGAQERWVELMDLYDLRQLPRAARPEVTRVIGCRRDGLVPAHHAGLLAETWGAPIQWMDVGHIGAALTRGSLFRQAIRDVLGVTRKGRRHVLAARPETT